MTDFAKSAQQIADGGCLSDVDDVMFMNGFTCNAMILMTSCS